MSTQRTLEQLGLPPDLVTLIHRGTLEQEIELAQRSIDRLNDAIDVWEAENPERVLEAPWHDAREAWKAAGRPRPHWLDLLIAVRWRPFKLYEVVNVYPEHEHAAYARKKSDPVWYEKYRMTRRGPDRRLQRRKAEQRRLAAAAEAATRENRKIDISADAAI